MSSWWNPSYVPPDLRKRAVYLYCKGETVENIAQRLFVSKAGIYRWIATFEETGDVYTHKAIQQHQSNYTKPCEKKLQQPQAREVLYGALDRSSASYLYEYQYDLLHKTGIEASISTIDNQI